MKNNEPLNIENKIYTIRNTKVMLDSDLAELYDVDTKVLNQAVSRNKERFPMDFMFRLTQKEFANLKSQIVTPKENRTDNEALRSQNVTLDENKRGKHKKYTPRVFTEQGVAMLSGVIKSKQAIAVNITIMRAFVAMKNLMLSEFEIKNRFDIIQLQLEKLNTNTSKHEERIKSILNIIDIMLQENESNKNQIGFKLD